MNFQNFPMPLTLSQVSTDMILAREDEIRNLNKKISMYQDSIEKFQQEAAEAQVKIKSLESCICDQLQKPELTQEERFRKYFEDMHSEISTIRMSLNDPSTNLRYSLNRINQMKMELVTYQREIDGIISEIDNLSPITPKPITTRWSLKIGN